MKGVLGPRQPAPAGRCSQTWSWITKSWQLKHTTRITWLPISLF